MESSQIFESVGGVADVVLYPAGTPLDPIEQIDHEELPQGARRIAIMERASNYTEVWSCRSSSREVRHTLTLVTAHGGDAMSDDEVQSAIRRGVVADVTLASGAKIRVGWSDEHEDQFPLRLRSVSFDSGVVPLDIPRKKWVWESVDTSPLI